MADSHSTSCRSCGALTKQPDAAGRPRKYCSIQCKDQSAYCRRKSKSSYEKKQTVFTCKECGVLFLRMPGQSLKWCSEGCRPIIYRTWWKESKSIRPCISCGDHFAPSGSTAFAKYCSNSCRVRYLDTHSGVWCKCKNCDKDFEKIRNSEGLYCSRDCQGEYSKKGTLRKKLRSGVFSDIHYGKCRVCKLEMGPSKTKPGAVCIKCQEEFGKAAYTSSIDLLMDRRNGKPCCVCGKSFFPYMSKILWCSSDCKKQTEKYKAWTRISKLKRRAREKTNGPYENIDPIAVFRRDKWACYLCGTKTPKRLRGSLEDAAPELDHIIPLAKGGDHALYNVACACRRCNQLKSANDLIYKNGLPFILAIGTNGKTKTLNPREGRTWQDTQTQLNYSDFLALTRRIRKSTSAMFRSPASR